jgi:hypothetical protein
VSYSEEFQTVDAVLACTAPTSGVDAFALTLIKAERQMRKLFTFLVFQSPTFASTDVQHLREILASSKRTYFRHFIQGWDCLYVVPIRDLVGENYDRLLETIEQSIQHRNKIFHGQLPAQYLSTEELLHFVSGIRSWCSSLADSAIEEVGYDGFGRNSYRKSERLQDLSQFKVTIKDVATYREFVATHLQ